MTIQELAKCIKPQFVWDNKSANKWLLTNAGRDHEFFSKDLGLLVFINVTNYYKLHLVDLQLFLGIDQANFKRLQRMLDFILNDDSVKESSFLMWQRKTIAVKSGLVKNLVYFNYGPIS